MNKIIVETEKLRRTLEAVKNGASKEDYRPVFKGICLEVENKMLTMITCDGYKIFKASCEIEEGEKIKIVIPIFKIPRGVGKQTIIEIDKEFITFDFFEEKHSYKLINGEFIDWKQFFEKKNSFKISFNAKYLKKALSGENGIVKLEFSDSLSPMFIVSEESNKLILPVRQEEIEREKNNEK